MPASQEVVVGHLQGSDERFGGTEAGTDLELSCGTFGDLDEDVDGVGDFGGLGGDGDFLKVSRALDHGLAHTDARSVIRGAFLDENFATDDFVFGLLVARNEDFSD